MQHFCSEAMVVILYSALPESRLADPPKHGFLESISWLSAVAACILTCQDSGAVLKALVISTLILD